MSQFFPKLLIICLGIFLLIPFFTKGASLDDLRIDFIPSSAIFPLDGMLKHRLAVKNAGDESLTIDFRIFDKDKEANQGFGIVGWPQPQILYLDPGEKKIVQTPLGPPPPTPGQFQRTFEWIFRDRKTGQEKKYEAEQKFIVLAENEISGDLKIKGKVVDENGKPVPDALVRISTGPGGWAREIRSNLTGEFSFPGLPQRDDWALETLRPGQKMERRVVSLEPGKTDYTLVLKEPTLKTNYQIIKSEKTEIGIWKGDVDENENYVLLINGMENWKDPSLKEKSKLYLYTLEGKLLWTYAMGWEGWGASLSRDGQYAAFVTSNHTKNLGLIETATGRPIWLKRAEEFRTNQFPTFESKEIKISNTNRYIGLGSADGTLFLLELASGEVLWTQFLEGQIRGITFDKSDKFVYAGSGDGNAYKLKIEDGSLIWKVDIGTWPFGQAAFKLSHDEKLLASGGKLGEVTVIETETGKKLWQNDQLGCTTWLDFSPNGKYLIAGGGGQGATTLYEAKTGRKIWRINQFSHQGKFSADGKFILIGGRDLHIFDFEGNGLTEIIEAGELAKYVGHGQFAYVSKDGQRIVYTRRDMDPGVASIIFAEHWTEEVLHPEEVSPVPVEKEEFVPSIGEEKKVTPITEEESKKVIEREFEAGPEKLQKSIFQKIWEAIINFFKQIFRIFRI